MVCEQQQVRNFKNTMFATVIINCHNGEMFLEQTLQSLMKQTDQDFEIIFWDNASTDFSAKIAHGWPDKRMRYFYNSVKTGLSEARNKAVQQVKTNWFGFLDADDIWKPSKLELQKKYIQNFERTHLNATLAKKDMGFVYNRASYFQVEGVEFPMQKKFLKKELPQGDIFFDLIFEENFVSLSSALISTKAFLQIGGIPLNLKQAEDYYLFCSLAENYSVGCLQAVLSCYRVHPGQLTSLQKSLAYEESIEVVDHFIQKHPEVLKVNENYGRLKKRYAELNTQLAISQIKYDSLYYRGLTTLMRGGSLKYLLHVALQHAMPKLFT
jgi:glycosyltransferase involved in cell wall biosynthesis